MILCICPSTTIERNWTIPNFSMGGFYRVEDELLLASGKGVNVARTIKKLSLDVICTGFVGGCNGDLFRKLITQENIQGKWVEVDNETRQSITVYDPGTHSDATSFCPRGPAVSPDEWSSFVTTLEDLSHNVDNICISGNIPPGIQREEFSSLIRSFRQANKKVWLDLNGMMLKTGIDAGPFAVKVNLREINELLKQPIHDAFEALEVSRKLRDDFHIATMIITLGLDGAVCSSLYGDFFIRPNHFSKIISSIGCGDAFIGGLLAKFEQGTPMMECLASASAAASANTQELGGGVFRLEDYYKALETTSIVKATIPTKTYQKEIFNES